VGLHYVQFKVVAINTSVLRAMAFKPDTAPAKPQLPVHIQNELLKIPSDVAYLDGKSKNNLLRKKRV
jgi:hypothetical protein